MARPQKTGLDYFALDVTMSDEVELIEAEYGLVGFAILIKLFQKIYSEGYYYEWTEREQILFSNRVSTDRNLATSIVNDCLKWNIFSQEMYKKYNILTSRRIQNHYITSTYKRINVEIIKEYLLIDVSDRTNLRLISVSDDRNEDTTVDNEDKSTQSKVEESKSKVNESSSNNNATAAETKETRIENPVAPIDAASIKQDTKPVADMDADSIQEDEKRNKDLQRIENYYKQQIRRRNLCSSRDHGDIVFVYETYNRDVDFIISVMEKAKEDYIARNGKLDINSFSYFLSIFEERWNILHGKKTNKSNNAYKSPTAKKTRFHNFEQRTSNMSNDDLEEIMRRKREEYYKNVREG